MVEVRFQCSLGYCMPNTEKAELEKQIRQLIDWIDEHEVPVQFAVAGTVNIDSGKLAKREV